MPACCAPRCLRLRHRDRHRGDRGGPRTVVLLPGRTVAEIDRLAPTCSPSKPPEHHRQDAQLPREAPGRITLLAHIEQVAHTALIKGKSVYRSRLIPATDTSGLARATSLNLLSVLNTGVPRAAPGSTRGPRASWSPCSACRRATARHRLDVLDQRIWLGGQWFNVVGVLESSPLEPDIDTSALIGYLAAQRYPGYVSLARASATPARRASIYVRADTDHVAEVQSLLAPTADPQAPDEVNVSHSSDALTARAAAAGAFDSLFLGLGVVALIVGAVGVANIMIISVLERRSEIGLRRALGATKSQIRTQFLGESILLAAIGGIVGVLAGAIATVIYASSKNWAIVIPVEAWTGGIVSAILIGAFAGLTPAIRASRLPPTVALRTA
ncbi:MAG: ABC transporter permease [Solirubrobacterales bacterium]